MKLLYFFAIVILSASCSAKNDDKAYASVNAYLKENMNDPKSYELISTQKDSLFREHDSRFVGWEIKHQYRGKNVFGALVSNKHTFHLDSNFTVIKVAATEPE